MGNAQLTAEVRLLRVAIALHVHCPSGPQSLSSVLACPVLDAGTPERSRLYFLLFHFLGMLSPRPCCGSLACSWFSVPGESPHVSPLLGACGSSSRGVGLCLLDSSLPCFVTYVWHGKSLQPPRCCCFCSKKKRMISWDLGEDGMGRWVQSPGTVPGTRLHTY